uniref:UPAR/Ly6 domain-containing protein n=1 Tax=Panagrolaimus sp. ES5 TaxID=591445 RepID=A0AC34GQF7_9BILA
MAIFFCVLAGTLAIDCKHSRYNVRTEGGDITLQTITCENDTYCVTVSGNDKNDADQSFSYSYRGCYSDFEKMKEHYHNPTCPGGGHFNNAGTSGDLICCKENLCNPASTTSFSIFLLALSVSALFYVFLW